MTATKSETLEKLQSQCAYTEWMLTERNAVVTAQARDIDLLTAEKQMLSQQVVQLQERQA